MTITCTAPAFETWPEWASTDFSPLEDDGGDSTPPSGNEDDDGGDDDHEYHCPPGSVDELRTAYVLACDSDDISWNPEHQRFDAFDLKTFRAAELIQLRVNHDSSRLLGDTRHGLSVFVTNKGLCARAPVRHSAEWRRVLRHCNGASFEWERAQVRYALYRGRLLARHSGGIITDITLSVPPDEPAASGTDFEFYRRTSGNLFSRMRGWQGNCILKQLTPRNTF